LRERENQSKDELFRRADIVTIHLILSGAWSELPNWR